MPHREAKGTQCLHLVDALIVALSPLALMLVRIILFAPSSDIVPTTPTSSLSIKITWIVWFVCTP